MTLTGRSATGDTDQAVADGAGTDRIVRLCGYPPLAIVLLAGRLAHHPRWTVTGLADQFAAAADRLAELDTGDRAVRAAFTLSYRDLTPQRQLLFRRAGLHPGPDVDVYTTAALADISVETARRELAALYTDHCWTRPSQGCYRLHDYACTPSASDPDRDNDEALGRLPDYHQHTPGAADPWHTTLAGTAHPTHRRTIRYAARHPGAELRRPAAGAGVDPPRAGEPACLP